MNEPSTQPSTQPAPSQPGQRRSLEDSPGQIGDWDAALSDLAAQRDPSTEQALAPAPDDGSQQPEPAAGAPASTEPAAQQGEPSPFAALAHGAVDAAVKAGKLDAAAQQSVEQIVSEALEGLVGGDAFPGELMERVKGVAKVGDSELSVSFREALNGYQRLSDYTRSKQAAKAEIETERAEVLRSRAELATLVDGWNDPATIARDMQALGKMEAFERAAYDHVRAIFEDQKLKTENPLAYEARQLARTERAAREKLEREIQLGRQREQAPKPHDPAQVQQLAERLQALVFPALKARGVEDSPVARQRFQANFATLQRAGVDLAVLVNEAAQATAEDMVALAKISAPASSQAAQRLPSRPAAAPGASTLPQAAGNAPRRLTLDGAEKLLWGR